MNTAIDHVMGTGTIGEPLIGLPLDFRESLGVEEVTFHGGTPLLTDRSNVVDLMKRGAKLCVDESAAKGFQGLGVEPSFEAEEAVARAGVIIDCTPSGVGTQNKTDYYERYRSNTAGFIAQGSEFGLGRHDSPFNDHVAWASLPALAAIGYELGLTSVTESNAEEDFLAQTRLGLSALAAGCAEVNASVARVPHAPAGGRSHDPREPRPDQRGDPGGRSPRIPSDSLLRLADVGKTTSLAPLGLAVLDGALRLKHGDLIGALLTTATGCGMMLMIIATLAVGVRLFRHFVQKSRPQYEE